MISKQKRTGIDRSHPAYRRLVEGVERDILEARKKMSQVLEQEKNSLFLEIGRQIYEFHQSSLNPHWGQDVYLALVKDIKEFFTWMTDFSERDLKNMKRLYRAYLEVDFEPGRMLPFECRKIIDNFARGDKVRTSP